MPEPISRTTGAARPNSAVRSIAGPGLTVQPKADQSRSSASKCRPLIRPRRGWKVRIGAWSTDVTEQKGTARAPLPDRRARRSIEAAQDVRLGRLVLQHGRVLPHVQAARGVLAVGAV